ncbi:MAG: hypothetical protein ABMA01_02905 [Chthoniobacteraceae bacterium]
MLIPFLDILCSLIGVLILIIVVLCVAQTQKISGRTAEEVQRAAEALRMKKELVEREKQLEQVKLESPAAANKDALKQRLTAIVNLQRELVVGEDARKKNQETSAELQKKLEDMLAQLEAMKKEKPELTKVIEQLKAELLKRNKKPDDTPPAIIVQTGGTGTSAGAQLFFVECAGAGIVMHKSLTEKTRITSASIGVDEAYNKFLEEAKKTPNAMVLFLLRDDGLAAYNRAAGWAEGQFGLRTGKLPLPGKGAADLSAFFPK